MAEMMCACANFARSCGSRTQIGDQLDKINSMTFPSPTVVLTPVVKDVSCVVLLVRLC